MFNSVNQIVCLLFIPMLHVFIYSVGYMNMFVLLACWSQKWKDDLIFYNFLKNHTIRKLAYRSYGQMHSPEYFQLSKMNERDENWKEWVCWNIWFWGMTYSSLDGFYSLVLVQEGNIWCHLYPHCLTTPKTTVTFGIRVYICYWGGHRAERKWNFLL